MAIHRFPTTPDDVTYEARWDDTTGEVTANFRGQWILCGRATIDFEEADLVAKDALLGLEIAEMKRAGSSGVLSLAASFACHELGRVAPLAVVARTLLTGWECLAEWLPLGIDRQRLPHTCANAVVRMVARSRGLHLTEREVAVSVRGNRAASSGFLSTLEIRRALAACGITTLPLDPLPARGPSQGTTCVIVVRSRDIPWAPRWSRELQGLLRLDLYHALLAKHGADGSLTVSDPSWLHGGLRSLSPAQLAQLLSAPGALGLQIVDGPPEVLSAGQYCPGTSRLVAAPPGIARNNRGRNT